MIPPLPSSGRRPWWLAASALALVVLPWMLTSGRGVVVANTDSLLLTDPAEQLRRSVSVWNPHLAMGTVADRDVGMLWPLGPYFWLVDRLGFPDWFAQRFLLATLLSLAGIGVLFLCRTWRWRPTAAVAGAFLYALSPYVLPAAVRDIRSLFAFAGLPWLLALTIRATRSGTWRHPAAFALVAATIGSTDAPALVIACLAPAAWILFLWLATDEISGSHALKTAAKIAILTIAVNLWWIGAAVVQAANGIDPRQFAVSPAVAADASSATEVLRGLGNWILYRSDRAGALVSAGPPYTQNVPLLVSTLVVPVVGLAGLGLARWRHRAFVVTLLVLGAVVAVGAHQWGDPSPLGALVEAFATTDAGQPLRGLTRAVPLAVLALALGVGSLVGAAAEQVPRRGLVGAVLAVAIAIAGLPALWNDGFIGEGRSRPEALPAHWLDLAEHLDDGDATRVLEIPGSDTGAYRWGDTADSILPALIDRPTVTREREPRGSAASADLVTAIDDRLQDQILEPAALATIARVAGVGDIVVRNDLRHERYDLVRPAAVWDLMTRAPGLAPPVTFGPTAADDDSPVVDEASLAQALPTPPAVATFPVLDPQPVVRAGVADDTVLLSGDGFGIVDAASAGLIDGDAIVRYSADLTADPSFVVDGLVDDRTLIVTDTNRRRARRWTSVRDSYGYTEMTDGSVLRTDLDDRRLPLFDTRPEIQSVAVQRGIEARATSYGSSEGYQPENRPFAAVDGDRATAWRVDVDDAKSGGERIELSVPAGITTDRVVISQPPSDDGRVVTADLRFDGGDSIRVDLDPSSIGAPGQTVVFDRRTFERLEIEIIAVDDAPDRTVSTNSDGVGFAEVDLGVEAREYIRMPQDLLDAGGFRTLRYPLALVQTRERSVDTDTTRADEERALARLVDLPTAREYRLTGTARLAADASTDILDSLLGRDGTSRVTATSVLPGGLRHLPSNVLDDDPSTRWTSAFVPGTEVLEIAVEGPVPVTGVRIDAIDDEQHSLPSEARILVDGTDVGTVTFAPGAEPGTTRAVADIDAVASSTIAIVFDEIETRSTNSDDAGPGRELPIAVATLDVGDLVVPPLADRIDTGCRSDLVRVDGIGTPVRIVGSTSDALDGRSLALESCDDAAVALAGGEHEMVATRGDESGVDVDQLVWCSGSQGSACEGSAPLPVAVGAAPVIDVVGSDSSSVDVDITGARRGEPFWLVLGQSFERGWAVVDDDVDDIASPTRLVDGAMNGFLITPQSSDFSLTMQFTPQNGVDIGMLLSIVGLAVVLGLALAPGSPEGPVPIALQEPLRRIRALSWEGGLPTRRDAVLVAGATAIGAGIVVTPPVGIVMGAVAGLATRRESWRPLFTVLPSAMVGVSAFWVATVQVRDDLPHTLRWPIETGAVHRVALAAIVLLAVDLAIDHVWARRSDFR